MAIIILSSSPKEYRQKHDTALPNPIAIGLLCATTVTFKTTFLLFFGLYLFAASVSIYAVIKNFHRSILWGLTVSLSFLAFLSPWIILHGLNYLTLLGPAAAAAPSAESFPPETLNLLSTDRLFWGATMVNYTGLIGAIGLAGIMTATTIMRSCDERDRLAAAMTVAMAAIGVTGYLMILVIFGPRIAGYSSSIRYFIPISIGIAPVVFGASARHMARSWQNAPWILHTGLPLAVAIVPVVAFGPFLYDRVEQALTSGSTLAFSDVARSPADIAYNEYVLNGSMQDAVVTAQSIIPAGAPIVAWINAPFYLDYARNPIADADVAGLATPWAKAPIVHYILWEYRGIATRTPRSYRDQMHEAGAHERMVGVRAFQFYQRLQQMAEQGDTLYNDGRFKVIHLTDELAVKLSAP
jgi:hypothetical protein